MKRYLLALAIVLPILACSRFNAATPDVEATVAAAVAATQTAQPSPTPTSQPTDTPTPTPTDPPTPLPTNTPEASPTPTADDSSDEVPELGDLLQRSEAASDVVTSTLESGWTLYEVEAEGFAIAIPPEWQQIDLNPEAFGKMLGIVGEQNPALKGMFSGELAQNLIASGVKFYGLDLSADSLAQGMPSSVNVIKLDTGLKLPLDAYVQINLQQIEGLADPDSPFTHQRVTLNEVEAEELKYSMKMAGVTGKQVSMMITQYLLLDETVAYVVTLSSPVASAEANAPVFEEISQSFRLLR